MPRHSKSNSPVSTIYNILYSLFLVSELIYIIVLLSPYGRQNGKLHDMYQFIKINLNIYVTFTVTFLLLFSFYFPGLGWLTFIVTLWRIANFCCNRENFGDGLNYGWGRYYPDSATFFNQPQIEREQDGTRAAYSSAVGDNKDSYWISKLAEYENRIAHKPIHSVRRKKFSYEKDGCGYGNWIIPNIKDTSVLGCKNYLCDGSCTKCSIQQYGHIFEMLNTPRPLYTTSLLAKEMDSA